MWLCVLQPAAAPAKGVWTALLQPFPAGTHNLHLACRLEPDPGVGLEVDPTQSRDTRVQPLTGTADAHAWVRRTPRCAAASTCSSRTASAGGAARRVVLAELFTTGAARSRALDAVLFAARCPRGRHLYRSSSSASRSGLPTRGPRGASTLAAWMPTAGGGAPVPAQGRWLSPRLTAQVDLACRRATSGPRRRRRRQAGRLDPARWRDGAARRRDEAQRRDAGLQPLHPLCALSAPYANASAPAVPLFLHLYTLRSPLCPETMLCPCTMCPCTRPLAPAHLLPSSREQVPVSDSLTSDAHHTRSSSRWATIS